MERTGLISSLWEGVGFVLMVVAFVAIQIMIGGTRMVFSMPTYAVLGLVGITGVFSLRQPKPAPSQLCLAVAAAFFAYIVARAWLSPIPYIARSDLYSVLAGLIVYFYTACVLTRAKQRILFISLLLLLAIGHGLLGAIQFRHGDNFMPISWLKRYDYGTRASGFYICPNHLAGLLEVLGVLGLSVVCWSRWPLWAKLLVGYAVGICYLGVVLSGSRGGYLSTGVSLVVFTILSLGVLRRTRGQLFWKIGGTGVFVAILLAILVTLLVRKDPFLSGRAQNVFETTNMRMDLWQGALQQWKLEPTFGTGSATYLYFGRFFRTDRVQNDPVYVHNDYLQLLAEYGLVGAIGFVLFLVTHLWYGAQNFARLGPKRVAVSHRILSNALALNVGALSAVASYMAHSVVDFNLHIPGNVLLMAFVFGLLANDGVVREKEPSAVPASRSLWPISLPILGVVLIVQCVRILPGEYFAERARMAVRDERPALGIFYALRGLESDPENPDLHYRLGMARRHLGERMEYPEAVASFYREAIAALQQARALAPQEEIYAIELATLMDSAERFEEAEWVFYEALQLDPKSTSLRRYYDRHLDLWRKSGGSDEAPRETAS